MTNTRKDALQVLLSKLAAGVKYETMGHTRMCQRAFPKPDDFDESREAYSDSAAQQAILVWRNGSLDAALALHNAALPVQIAKLHISSTNSRAVVGVHSGTATNPARAWLIAILKALIAEITQ
jgi:hypothetical protein